MADDKDKKEKKPDCTECADVEMKQEAEVVAETGDDDKLSREEELEVNPRSRSAKLRIMEKI